jgi:hypothetical protein
MAREQPRIGSTKLYRARALTCAYAIWCDQPRLVSTAGGGLIIRRSWVRAPPASLTCLLAVRNQRILIAWDARQADGARRAAAGQRSRPENWHLVTRSLRYLT